MALSTNDQLPSCTYRPGDGVGEDTFRPGGPASVAPTRNGVVLPATVFY